jgi:hypothetical protein
MCEIPTKGYMVDCQVKIDDGFHLGDYIVFLCHLFLHSLVDRSSDLVDLC